MSFALYVTFVGLPLHNISLLQFFDFLKKNFGTKNFEILKSTNIGHETMLMFFFHDHQGLNPIISNIRSLKRWSRWYFSYFLQIFKYLVNHDIPLRARSSSGWVLIVRKVLPSKSMKSQLSNAPSHVFIAILDQKLSYFQVQKYHCYSASLRCIMYKTIMKHH